MECYRRNFIRAPAPRITAGGLSDCTLYESFPIRVWRDSVLILQMDETELFRIRSGSN